MNSAPRDTSLLGNIEEPDCNFDPNRADANFVRLLLAESTRHITKDTPPPPTAQLFLELEEPGAA